jgi:hypothetical protein
MAQKKAPREAGRQLAVRNGVGLSLSCGAVDARQGATVTDTKGQRKPESAGAARLTAFDLMREIEPMAGHICELIGWLTGQGTA